MPQIHRFLRRNDTCLGNRLNRPGRPLLRSDTLPTSSLFVQRKDTNRLSADAGTGKNVAPSFSSPDRTATGVRQAVISAPGPHWHAADRILHASVHAESPSTCTKALSTCPEPRPDTSMTACHGAEHPHGKPKPTYVRLFPPASFEHADADRLRTHAGTDERARKTEGMASPSMSAAIKRRARRFLVGPLPARRRLGQDMVPFGSFCRICEPQIADRHPGKNRGPRIACSKAWKSFTIAGRHDNPVKRSRIFQSILAFL